jgi:hypothetical protein
MNASVRFTLATSVLVVMSYPAVAEQQAAVAVPAGPSDQPPAPVASVVPAQPAAAAAKSHRWFDLSVGVVDARYRFIESSASVVSANQAQHRQTLKGAFKFDPKGHYTIQAGLGTGNNFIASWDTTGAGTGDPAWNFRVRTLYVSAQPVQGLEIQVGGLAPIRGESTEITSYDNDGFLVGERVSVKQPKRFYMDEVSATVGYLGDLTTPNVFKRFDRMDAHNYTQLLAAKTIGRVSLSAHWTTAADVETWREAVRIAARETRIVDGVRLELYQRVDAPDGRGFAVSADKALTGAVALSGGFADIDRNHEPLNSDRFLRGRRVFAEGRVNLTPELSMSVFYTRAVHNDFAVPIATRFDLIVSYNVLKGLQRAGAI